MLQAGVIVVIVLVFHALDPFDHVVRFTIRYYLTVIQYLGSTYRDLLQILCQPCTGLFGGLCLTTMWHGVGQFVPEPGVAPL
uniref:Putative secreted peptide n=1 Tax=Anopheles braziliensis TaxID=58242 RepID=A0A2M3ZTV2_9DIPT